MHRPYIYVTAVFCPGIAQLSCFVAGDRLGCNLSQGYVLQLVPDELKSMPPQSGDEARLNKSNAAKARTAAMVASTSASMPSPKHSQQQSEAGQESTEDETPSEVAESTSESGASESGGAAAEPLAGIRWPSIGGTDAAEDNQALTLASLQSDARGEPLPS